MCDYCGCRDVAPIGELSEDHERIRRIAGRLRRALELEDRCNAERELRELQLVLRLHLACEESGIFAQLEASGEMESYLQVLHTDHIKARARLIDVDPQSPGSSSDIVAALAALDEHITLEEYDLFPAARTVISDRGWAEVDAVHSRLRRASSDAAPAHTHS